MELTARRIRYAVALFLGCTAFVALQIVPYVSAGPEGGVLDPWATFLTVECVAWYSWMAIVPLIDRHVRRSLPGHRLRVFAGHVALAVPFAALHGAVVLGTATLLGAHSLERRTLLGQISRQEVVDGIFYSLLAGGFTLAESRRRQALAVQAMRAEVAEARLESLRQQLNPHFLFNTLNHIVMQLRLRETDAGIRMVLSLSELLRAVLADRAQLTPLKRELAIIDHYLEIERARFGDRLNVEVNVDPAVTEALVPSFLLQPLLENALKHGVSPVDGHCRVRVNIGPEGNRLRISVQDEGPGLSEGADGLGIGIANTRERLKHLYGADFTLSLEPAATGGALAQVAFPLRR